MVAKARGIFLGGGDQVKLITTLSGTPVGDAIWDNYVSGGVVCGTSAGAAALTELTLAGNEVDEEGNLVEQYIGPGLGLLDSRRSSTRISRSGVDCIDCSSPSPAIPRSWDLASTRTPR